MTLVQQITWLNKQRGALSIDELVALTGAEWWQIAFILLDMWLSSHAHCTDDRWLLVGGGSW